jgi:hypothetical protein
MEKEQGERCSHGLSSRMSSRHRRPSNLSSPSRSGPSTEASSFTNRNSSTRNRFFRRRPSVTHDRDDLMEQGRVDSLLPAAVVQAMQEQQQQQ